MSDLIDRQQAIDALRDAENHAFNSYYQGLIKAHKIIADLPSAQPEIVKCKDCKYNVSSHKCLHPESFFLVPDDNFYCGYAERRTDEPEK